MANKGLISFIIRKYLSFDRTQPFISIAAILAFGGVAVGVMVLMVAMAIETGMSREFERKLLTMNYPITLYPRMEASMDTSILAAVKQRLPGVKASPFITSSAIAQGGEMMDGVIVFGVDFAQEVAVNTVFAEALRTIHKQGKLDIFDAIIGKELAKTVSDGRLTLYLPHLEATGLGLSPVMKRLSVAGSFSSGLVAYDKAYVYTSLEAMRALLGVPDGMVSGIHLYSSDATKDADTLRALLPPTIAVVGWWEQNGNFFAALAMEKRALFIVLMLIIFVASLNIISSLLMTVMSRRKEIALLLSLGATPQQIRRIFFALGSIIGGGGIVAGVFLGFGSIWLLGSFDIVSLPADVYGTSKLPLELDGLDFVAIVAGAALIVLFSSWYPAKKAGEVDALTVLRNE